MQLQFVQPTTLKSFSQLQNGMTLPTSKQSLYGNHVPLSQHALKFQGAAEFAYGSLMLMVVGGFLVMFFNSKRANNSPKSE